MLKVQLQDLQEEEAGQVYGESHAPGTTSIPPTGRGWPSLWREPCSRYNFNTSNRMRLAKLMERAMFQVQLQYLQQEEAGQTYGENHIPGTTSGPPTGRGAGQALGESHALGTNIGPPTGRDRPCSWREPCSRYNFRTSNRKRVTKLIERAMLQVQLHK